MKKLTLIAICFLVSGVCLAEDSLYDKKIGITIDAMWVSKYIRRGHDQLNDHGAFQPSINFDLYQSGFSTKLMYSYPNGSGLVDRQKLTYSVTYANELLLGENMRTLYWITWLYYDRPNMASEDSDYHEADLYLAWPDALPWGIVPTYEFSYLWAAKDGGWTEYYQSEGFYHCFGLNYPHNVEGLKYPVNLHWDIAYNDGQGYFEYDHDFSHMTWGLSTAFEAAGGIITPSVYYQTSMEKTTNVEDEFWVEISYEFHF